MFNKSAIMSAAWKIARRMAYTGWNFSTRLAHGLRCAWKDAKFNAAVTARVDSQVNALASISQDALRHEIVVLQNTTYLKEHGIKRLRELEAELRRRG